jgi:hypoxanthine phosphoribosyltransferase
MSERVSSDGREVIIGLVDTPIKLIALVVLVLEAFLGLVIFRAGKAEWYVVVFGVIPLLIIVTGVFFGRGVRSWAFRDISWKVEHLRQRLISARFIPDLIIGLSRGGLVIASELSHKFETDPPMPIISLWPHLQKYANALNSFDLRKIHELHEKTRRAGNNNSWNVLIVDDACSSGRSLRDAKSHIEREISGINCCVETAVLEVRKGEKTVVFKPTFVGTTVNTPKDVWGHEEP